MKIFLSYSHNDAARARELRSGLESLGHTVWVDGAIPGGADWKKMIEDEIRGCDAVLFALSHDWLASWECHKEWEIAFKLHKHLLPVKVVPDLISPPSEIAAFQILDGSRPAEQFAFELARAVQPRSTSPPASRDRSPIVVAATGLGSVSLMHAGFITGFYADVLGGAKGIVVFNLVLAVLGLVACLVAGRHRTALIGAAFCLAGTVGAVADGIHLGVF